DEREPAMWGRLTLTTEVSSTSMTALDITAMAMIQRCPSETIGAAEDAGIMEEPEFGTDWTAGSETRLLQAEIRLETDISSPAQPGF
ncbi:MAG: hypothetical protein WB616_01870, partial [Candidatus Sulfotelmatobacter sp.]